jgi:hypothetical protein
MTRAGLWSACRLLPQAMEEKVTCFDLFRLSMHP